MDRGTAGIALVFAGAALFGTLGIFGEVATIVGLSTATLLGARFVAATAALWAYLLATGRHRRLDRRTLAAEVGLGVSYAVMSLAYFESLAWLTAGVAVLILFTYPVQVTLVSAVTLSEPVTVPKVLALVAAVGGVVLVVGATPTAVHPAGVVLVVVASLAYTAYSTGTRAVVDRGPGTDGVAPLVHATYVFSAVTPVVLGYGLVRGTLSAPASGTEWALIAGITVLGTLVPMVLFTAGLSRVAASKASIVSTSEPLTTVVLGIALLGEPLTLSVVLGGTAILSGIVLTSPAVERATRARLGRVRRRLAREPDPTDR